MKIYYRTSYRWSTGKQVTRAWLEEEGKEDLLNLCIASGIELSQSFKYGYGSGNIWAPVEVFTKLVENAALLGYEFVEEEDDDYS